MNYSLVLSNITNPTLLFFLLGVLASIVKSDLVIPASSSKFISLYLLFSIGFKGGQELAHSGINMEITKTLLMAVALAILVPAYVFYLTKPMLGIYNAGAVAATYGSVSAVTFVTAISFLDMMKVNYGGHMVAAMALMEAPAIIVGVLLMKRFDSEKTSEHSIMHILRESLTNGSVFMILGSLVIGMIADAKQAEGIRPFTTDIFKGFLALFLLEMGMIAAREFKSFRAAGIKVTIIAVLVPVINCVITVLATKLLHISPGNSFLLVILASSASYIAVPAAMRQVAPKADAGLYIPMALGITFPLNISVGLPVYWALIQYIN